jgi:hypothetical protein
MTPNHLTVRNDVLRTSIPPERSEWTCYMFGAVNGEGIQYTPAKGREPHWFARWMMRICFDCRWVNEEG